ncbi:hypothetical protein [Actinoplanes sp. NPDC051851]|uniref:hypothetical protein n=1 Tax=Actinoplanes sp. NPDC051851 TaxID=3154753 RepID=UPI0034142920
MSRRLLPLLAVAGALLVPATPASAHGGESANVTSYRTAVTGISSPMSGLSVRVVEGGARLELTNDTSRTIEILGYSGEPYLEIRPDGTYQNTSSPATYINETLAGDTPVPSTADVTTAPTWSRISSGTTVRWHDQRTHWTGTAVTSTTTRHLRDWTVPLRDQARTFEITGTLDYEPAPAAWAWWLTAVLLGLTAAGLAWRLPRSITPLTLLTAFSVLTYATSSALDGSGWSGVLLLAAALGLAAAYRHPPFFLTLTGFVLAAFAGFGSADVFFYPVLPTAGPAWLARTAVAATIGLGSGLALAGLLQMRAATPDPVAAPEPLAAS